MFTIPVFRKLRNAFSEVSPNLQKLISNTGWLVAERLVRMGLSLVVGVWVARYLGPESYGILNYAFALVFMFEPISHLGVGGSIVVRDLVQNFTDRDKILGTAFILKLAGSIIVLPLPLIAISFLQPDNQLIKVLVATISVGVSFKSFEVIDFWFQSQIQSKYTVWLKSITFTTTSFLKVILIVLGAPLSLFAVTITLELLFDAIGMIVAYQWRKYSVRAWRFSATLARTMLKDSLPLLFSALVIALYMQVDQVMLGQMVNAYTVGVYSAAVKMSTMWYFIPSAISTSVFPSIVESKQISESVYSKRVQKSLCLMVLISYAASVFVTLFSNRLVVLLLGTEYLESSSILAIHIWAGIFVGLGLIANTWIITEGLMHLSLVTTVIGLISNLIMNYFLIPKYAGEGAAIATLVSQFLASCFAYSILAETRALFIMQIKALLNPLAFLKFS